MQHRTGDPIGNRVLTRLRRVGETNRMPVSRGEREREIEIASNEVRGLRDAASLNHLAHAWNGDSSDDTADRDRKNDLDQREATPIEFKPLTCTAHEPTAADRVLSAKLRITRCQPGNREPKVPRPGLAHNEPSH